MTLEVSGIYQIKNKINGKFYIGSAINLCSRWSKHKYKLKLQTHENSYLQNAWNKYGEENFVFEVLQYCNKNDLLKYEQSWLDWTEACKFGYNSRIIANSNLGKKWTDEHKLKISLSKKGIPQSKEFIAKRMLSIRKFNKWPHEKGHKCKCIECKTKRNDLDYLRRITPKTEIKIYSNFTEAAPELKIVEPKRKSK